MRRTHETQRQSPHRRFASILACVFASALAFTARPALAGGVASANCPADIAPNGFGDGAVNIDDLLYAINHWGPCLPSCPAPCAADVVHNCNVNIDDLLFVINHWGACPPCPTDSYEPDDSCLFFKTLSQIGSNQTLSYPTLTLHEATDADFFRIQAKETDSSCSCCDGFCTDEDYRLTITLTVPASAAVPYQFCTNYTPCDEGVYCVNVLPGQTETWTYNLDGSCLGNDEYEVFLRIRPAVAGYTGCAPYTLSYHFATGCFGALDQPDEGGDALSPPVAGN